MLQSRASDELHGLRQLPYWTDAIDSSSNYQTFLCCAYAYNAWQQLLSITQLHSVSHKFVFGFDTPLLVSLPNSTTYLPWRPCEQVTRRRCESVQGGCKLKWVGPWTVEASHVDKKPSTAKLMTRRSRPCLQGNLRGHPHDGVLLATD